MSTFGSFSTVKLGIYAAQKGLDVTGNNITNINTPGYTRQRLEQSSLVTSSADRYYSIYKTRVGQGVVTTGVTQLREPGLDLSYRNSTSDVGSADAKLAGLEDLAAILDEVGKGDLEQDDGVLLNQLNDLRDLISQAITNGIEEYDGLIRTSAQALCTLFNSAANSLSELQKKYETRLEDQVDTINSILTNLRDLNVSIRNADIRGDNALELRDERNRLLDELSQYVKIDVQYTMEDVGAGFMVENMSVSLATGDRNTLVDGEFATQLSLSSPKLNPGYNPNVQGSYPYLDANGNSTANWELAAQTDNPNYGITLRPMEDAKGHLATANDLLPNANAPLDLGGVDLGDTDLYGALQSTREILTEKGEYTIEGTAPDDPNANVKRGIPYYQKALDNLAYEFAEQMNLLNRIEDVNGNLIAGGNLFSISSNSNDSAIYDNAGNRTGGITAANISVSKAWADGDVSIQAKGDLDAPSGDTSNLVKFLAIFDEKQSFDPDEMAGEGSGPANAMGSAYEGTFEDMLLRIQSVLAEDQMATSSVLTNYTVTNNEIYMSRDSVMGVDLNDEATSLMVYQKAYTAACRLMTVLEEALDSLINGTIV